MTAKNVIASCLVIALGIILAIHFALFWLYGGVFIHESNRVILTIETVMSIAIFIFGIERLVSSANSKHRERMSVISDFKTKVPHITEHIASKPLPRGIEQVGVLATTAAAFMPATTALHIESHARYMNNCSLQMSEQTGAYSDIVFHFTDGEDETTVYPQAISG